MDAPGPTVSDAHFSPIGTALAEQHLPLLQNMQSGATPGRQAQLGAEPHRKSLRLQHHTPKWMPSEQTIRGLLSERPTSLDTHATHVGSILHRPRTRLHRIRELVIVSHEAPPYLKSSFR